MKKKILLIVFILTAAVALTALNISAAAQTETPIENAFRDPTLWKLVPAKDWVLENGVLKGTNNTLTASAVFLPEQYKKWTGYEVTVKVRPGESDSTKAGYAGINVKGVGYLVRQDGLSAVYQGKNGRLEGTSHPQTAVPGKFYEIRIVTGGKKITGYLDGKPWLSLAEVPAPDEGIYLICSHLTGEFSDFKVVPMWENEAQDLAGIESGVNLLPNSSFENVPEDLPAGWRPARYIHQFPNEKDYFDSLTVVDSNAFNGNRCVQLTTLDEKYPAGLSLENNLSIGEKKTTFSVYLKANRPDARVLIGAQGINMKEIQVDTDWRRYTNTIVPKPGQNLRVTIQVELKSQGVLWVDAAQLETGEQASEYQTGPAVWLPTSEKNKVEIQPGKMKVYPLLLVPDGAMKMDGNLDEKYWAVAAPIMLSLLKTHGRPKETAFGKILCDSRNLYIGYTCEAAAERQIPVDESTRVNIPWATDSVEFLVDTSGQRKSVQQFAANLSGARASSRGRLGTSSYTRWNGDWTSIGKRKDGFYTVEMQIPLANLNLDENAPRRWPINLARSNPATGEYLCSSPCLHSYSEPENYDEMQLPDNLDLRPFAVSPTDLKLVASDVNGTYRLTGDILNRTGRDNSFTLIIIQEGDNEDNKGKMEVKAGQTGAFSLEGINLPAGQKILNLQIRLLDKDGGLVHADEKLVKVYSPFAAFPEFSYFSNEKSINIFAERPFVLEKNPVISGEASLMKEGITVKNAKASGKGRRLVFAFEREGLTPGEYTARIKITDNGSLWQGECPVTIKEYLKGETKLDYLRRCAVIRGKSTLVFLPSVMTYVGLDDNFWKLFFDNDIENVFIWPGRPHVDLMGEYLSSAEKFGRNLLIALPARKELADRPNLLGWMVGDEPSGEASIAKTIGVVDNARKIDDHHLIYVNQMPPQLLANYAGLPGDILSVDYYALVTEGRSIWEIGELTEKMNTLGEPRRLPVWFFLQGNYAVREPTAAELSAQTYMVLTRGGTGPTWFFGLPCGKRAWRRFVEINREMKALNDIILSIEEIPVFTQQHPDSVSATSRMLNGTVYLITVNGRRDPVEEIFTLPGNMNGEVEVMFEGRLISVRDGKIKDKFVPLERHVYKFKMGSVN